MHIEINHSIGKNEAIIRIKKLWESLKVDFKDNISNINETWDDNIGHFSFNAFGFDLKGKLVIEENKLQMDGKLPMAAIPFKGIIEDKIRSKATELLT